MPSATLNKRRVQQAYSDFDNFELTLDSMKAAQQEHNELLIRIDEQLKGVVKDVGDLKMIQATFATKEEHRKLELRVDDISKGYSRKDDNLFASKLWFEVVRTLVTAGIMGGTLYAALK